MKRLALILVLLAVPAQARTLAQVRNAADAINPYWTNTLLPAQEAFFDEHGIYGQCLQSSNIPNTTTADTIVQEIVGDAVDAVRRRVWVTTRFVAYHHRVSVGLVGRGGLSDALVRETASEVAGSIAFFDQRGCVSPQVVYVERGGQVDAAEFAHRVAEALAAVEDHLPGGTLEAAELSTLQQTRGTAELLAASGSGVNLYHGGNASWTVIFDPRSELAMTCVGRTLRVVPVDDAFEVTALLRPLSGHLQTVSVTGCGGRLHDLANDLAEVGVTRIAYFDQSPFPPPWWHHDGQGPLRALVDWVDLDAEG